MEDVKRLMELVDENSKNISEGNYLEMCNLLKNLHRGETTTLITEAERHSHLVQGVKEERLFYQAYKAFSNLEKMKKMQQLVDEKHRHTLELLHINVRINDLIDTYNL